MLRLENVSSGYGPTYVLRDVSISVQTGEVVAVVGANGAGKTTLLRTIAGLLPNTHGRLVYNDQPLNNAASSQIRRLGIGHAPEGRRIFASMSVYENLLLGVYTVPRRQRSAILHEQLQLVYSLFPVLQEMHKREAGVLSGGQQQMLSLGRAIMSKPSLLLLDEPSMGLAPNLVRSILDAVAELSRQGVSVLLVEQVVGLALSVSQRAYVLRSGRVVMDGPSGEIAGAEGALHQAYFGGAAPELGPVSG